MEQFTDFLLIMVGIYTMIGFFYHLYFISHAYKYKDSDAENTTFWFKLIILPGMLVFWPVILMKKPEK